MTTPLGFSSLSLFFEEAKVILLRSLHKDCKKVNFSMLKYTSDENIKQMLAILFITTVSLPLILARVKVFVCCISPTGIPCLNTVYGPFTRWHLKKHTPGHTCNCRNHISTQVLLHLVWKLEAEIALKRSSSADEKHPCRLLKEKSLICYKIIYTSSGG